MLYLVKRYLHCICLRYKLRRFITCQQDAIYVTLLNANKEETVLKYNIEDFENFRLKQNISRGEMGIFLREILWNPPFFSRTSIASYWLQPILDFYSPTDILALMFNINIDSLNKLSKHAELTILSEEIIKRRLYLYVKVR